MSLTTLLSELMFSKSFVQEAENRPVKVASMMYMMFFFIF